MNKKTLVQKIIAQLNAELALYTKAALAARAEATHEQSKAENKYDTRGLEASYLARGQSRQAAEIEAAIEQFSALDTRPFGPTDGIEIGALIELEMRGETSLYFLGPRAGGTEIQHGKKEILVITPTSPLGEQLLNHKQGERLSLNLGGQKTPGHLVAVS